MNIGGAVKADSNKNYNYGLAVLRIMMTFVVVLCHFWNSDDSFTGIALFFHKLKPLAVPTFLLMAFFFFEKSLHACSLSSLKKRISRLLVPHICWAFIYFGVEIILSKFFNIILYDTEYNMYLQLFWQVLLGSAKNLAPQFWYQSVLILYTILVWLIFKFIKSDKAYILLLAFTAASLFLQYSGINALWFGGLEYEQRYTLGRFVEMLPYIPVGLIIAKSGLVKILKKIKWVLLPLSAMIFVFLNNSTRFTTGDFGYGGIYLLFTSTLIFLFFSILPISVLPKPFCAVIMFVSKYAFGIFCSHFLVGRIFNYYITYFGIQISEFLGCVAIWAICFVLSFLISLIPSKFFKQIVE